MKSKFSTIKNLLIILLCIISVYFLIMGIGSFILIKLGLIVIVILFFIFIYLVNTKRKNLSNILSILSVIISFVSLAGSWIPFFNMLHINFAFWGIFIGIVGALIKDNDSKIHSLVGIALSIVSIIIVFIFISIYNDSVTSSNNRIEAPPTYTIDHNFKWKKEDVEKLVVGEGTYSEGGTELNEIIEKFGEPQKSSDINVEKYTLRTVEYHNVGDTKSQRVRLYFVGGGEDKKPFRLSSIGESGPWYS